jgi:anti-sigma-K factor RskA
MPGETENFDQAPALLLMYLADELSPRDRAELENRLRLDQALASELERLRAAQEFFDGAMKAMDFSQAASASDAAAADRADRAIRVWAAARNSRPRQAKPKEHFLPWWSYTLASAAAVLVAVVYWGIHNWDKQNFTPSDPSMNQSQTDGDDVAQDQPSTDNPAPQEKSAFSDLTDEQQQTLLGAFSSSDSETATDDNRSGLDEADRTIAALKTNDNVDNLLLDNPGKDDQRQETP